MEFEIGGEGVGFYLVVDRVWSGGGEAFGCGRCDTHDLWCNSLRSCGEYLVPTRLGRKKKQKNDQTEDRTQDLIRSAAAVKDT